MTAWHGFWVGVAATLVVSSLLAVCVGLWLGREEE